MGIMAAIELQYPGFAYRSDMHGQRSPTISRTPESPPPRKSGTVPNGSMEGITPTKWRLDSAGKHVKARRLAALGSGQSSAASFLAPLLLILMLVLFMYRKPIQNYFSGSNSAKPSYGGLRNNRKKAPIRHF